MEKNGFINKRNEKIDFLKGIAIFLVVYGHIIQYCIKDGQDFFLNPVFKTIYSFHMPLFMVISGYLFYNTLQKNQEIRILIYTKFRQLIVPAITWYTLYSIVTILVKIILKNSNVPKEIFMYIKGIPYQFWFLYVVFYLSIIVSIGAIKFKDKIIYYTVVYIILLLIPDKLNVQYLKFMYPYFLMGYVYNKNNISIKKYTNLITISSLGLFLLLLLGWKKDYYIYTTGMSLYNVDIYNKLFIISYRYLVGFVGSILIISISENIYKFDKYKLFINLGKSTLGIYIIQSYIMIFIEKLNINIRNDIIYNVIFTPLVSIFIMLICLLMINIINKNRIMKNVLLGNYNLNVKKNNCSKAS